VMVKKPSWAISRKAVLHEKQLLRELHLVAGNRKQPWSTRPLQEIPTPSYSQSNRP